MSRILYVSIFVESTIQFYIPLDTSLGQVSFIEMIIHRGYIRNVFIAETCNTMKSKENDTAAIFTTAVEIYESDLRLYRPSRSNKLKICYEAVTRNVSLQNSKNISKSNSKKTEEKFERLKRQKEIVRGFNNLNEVSKILDYQLGCKQNKMEFF